MCLLLLDILYFAAMDEVALKLITDEEFDFELACSPAAAGQE